MHLEIWKTIVFVVLIRGADSVCTTRRCLAEMLIKKNLLSQPQHENCSTIIEIPLLEYQTLAVDTKNLRLISRLHATVQWTDPELSWNTSEYQYNEAVLPVKSVWTPEIQVTNGITITVQPSSSDLVVFSNGTLTHSIILNAEVNCEVNLFNYPFASDACPVALHTWYTDGCGGEMILHKIKMTDGAHGDWQTQDVFHYQKGENRNYILERSIMGQGTNDKFCGVDQDHRLDPGGFYTFYLSKGRVQLKIRQNNPFITLMLPSILIILADVVSFALPLGGGERNGFKVTLVLSFTMFLVILNGELPGDSQCSPVIRIHFCVCLIILVFSMLVCMVLTRVAKEGGIIFCCCSKWLTPKNNSVMDEESRPDISVVQASPAEEEAQMLRKVVSFLEAHDAKEKEREKYEQLADTLDKIFFWIYLFLGTAYFIGMFCVMVKHVCVIDHFDFWD